MFDIIIIGAGVSGCAIARELSRKKRSIAVLEALSDICEGASKANSGIVHAGHDAKPDTLKAKLNVLGSRKMEMLSKELDFPYHNNGTFVLRFHQNDKEGLENLLNRGMQNGVEGLRILSGEEVRKMEQGISEEVEDALYAPSGAIVCPFGLTIAMAENAAENGTQFYLNTKVNNIEKQKDSYRIYTNNGIYESRIVINAAGLYADDIHNMISSHKIKVIPRRGEYLLFDKKAGNTVSHTIFQLPSIYGKGVLITPTIHGNLLMGPTAEDIEDKNGINTTSKGLETIYKKAAKSIKSIPKREVITSYAGLRAHTDRDDFIIEEIQDAPGFIDVAGIDSPGLSCAPAIGEYVAEMVQAILPAEDNQDFIATRKGIPNLSEASLEERRILIESDPAFANVICRCELITEGEILAAIHRPIGATTTDGIKRRTRAGMGRCQSGFCSPKVVEILAEELNKDPSEITKSGEGSAYLSGREVSL